MKSISAQVKEFVESNYYIKEAMILDIANLSKLANIIVEKIPNASFQAVHAALRRISYSLSKTHSKTIKKIKEILKKSRITLKSGLVSVKIKKTPNISAIISKINQKTEITIMQLSNIATLIFDKEYLNLIGNEEIIETNKNISSITIKSPKHLYVKGFIAFVSNLIASENINIIDFLSSYDEIEIFINDKDVPNAYASLNKFIK